MTAAGSQRLESTLHLLAVLLFAAPLVSLSSLGVSWLFAAMLAVLASTTAFRPAAGLLALALVLPLSFALASTSPHLGSMQVTECFVLVFVAASAARAAFDRGPAGHSRLAAPVIVFVAICLSAGLVGTLIQFDTWRAGVRGITEAMVTRHLQGHPIVGLQSAYRYAELAAFAFYVEAAMRRRPSWRHFVLTGWLAASAAMAAQSLVRAIELTVERGQGLAAVLELLRATRFSPLYADLNAAGSLFGMLTVIAVVYAFRARSRLVAIAAAPFLLFAFMAAQSRAAVLAVIVTMGFLVIRYLVRTQRRAWAAALLVVSAGGVATMTVVSRPTHVSAEAAMYSRLEMGKIALKIARQAPVFGVGPGHFQFASRDYVGSDLAVRFPEAAFGENAHNNFLQILAELGIPGLVAFLWLIWRALTTPAQAGADRVASGAVVSGLLAFLISSFGGHPLLVFEIATATFFAFGLAAGMAPVPEAGGRASQPLLWLLAGFVLITLPWRVYDAVTPGVPDVTGASAVQGEIGGVEYRVAEQQSRWRLRTRTRMVVALMRWDETGATDCRVRIVVTGRPADEVSLSAVAWQQVRFAIPPGIRPSLPPEVEFQVTSPACRLLVGTLTSIR